MSTSSTDMASGKIVNVSSGANLVGGDFELTEPDATVLQLSMRTRLSKWASVWIKRSNARSPRPTSLRLTPKAGTVAMGGPPVNLNSGGLAKLDKEIDGLLEGADFCLSFCSDLVEGQDLVDTLLNLDIAERTAQQGADTADKIQREVFRSNRCSGRYKGSLIPGPESSQTVINTACIEMPRCDQPAQRNGVSRGDLERIRIYRQQMSTIGGAVFRGINEVKHT